MKTKMFINALLASATVANAYSTQPLTTTLFVREEGDPPAAPETLTLTTAELQARIDAAATAAVTGLKTKNDELLGIVRSLKDGAKKFEGVDLEKLTALQQRLDQDEDVKLLAEGKTMQVIEKHTERMRAQHKAELEALTEKIAAADKRADSYKGHVLESQILSVTQGLHKGAVEDALLYGRNTFTLDENGKAVKMGPNNVPELGKDGTTPFGPAEWIEQMKEVKPHWFPAATSGSGSGGAREASGNGKTMKRADFDNLNPAEKARVAQAGTQIV